MGHCNLLIMGVAKAKKTKLMYDKHSKPLVFSNSLMVVGGNLILLASSVCCSLHIYDNTAHIIPHM